MATIKIKDGNTWVGIDALKGDPGEAYITAGSSNLPVNHLTDGDGLLFTINDGNLKIDNDIRKTIRSSAKGTNGRPGGEKAIRDALDMQQLTFNRSAYNLNSDCITPGFYPLAKNTTNYPSGAEEYGCCMVVPHYERYTVNGSTGEYSNSANNGKLCTQVYFTDGNDGVAGDAIFYRGRNTGDASSTTNWEPWKRIATSNDLAGKQDTLVSGTNIKTINNQSILGSGNITISGGSGTATDVQINGTSIVNNNTANIVTNTAYNATNNKIATMSDVPNVSNRLKLYSRSGYDVNTCYDAGIYLVAQGSHIPSGSDYGSLLTMPYRQIEGNTKPDFGTQIFMPNGDDNTHPNSFYYRTSLANTWNDWQELETTSNKVTSLSSSSTNTQYPSAKAVYDAINGSASVFKRDVNFGAPSTKYYSGLQSIYVPEREILEKGYILGYLKQESAGEGMIDIDNDGFCIIIPVENGKTYRIDTDWTNNYSSTSHCKWGPCSSLTPANGEVWTNGRDEGTLWSNQRSFTVTAYFTGYAIFQLYSSLQSGLTTNDIHAYELTGASGLPTFNRDTTYANMLTAFDGLVSNYPSYITKTELGVCSDGSTHLYEYDFIPFNKTYTTPQGSGNVVNMPKVLIIGGVHGFEKAGIFGLYFFLKDLCENWYRNDTLDYLRHNVIFKIIPVCNPYGWDRYQYLNANAVNINRNYDTPGFVADATGDQAGGHTPFDQPETQVIRDFVSANTDALFFIDFHTNGSAKLTTGEENKINWIDTIPNQDDYYEFIIKCCNTHLNNLKGHFNKDYSLGLSETAEFGTLTNGNSQFNENFPSGDAWATTKKNIIGLTLEGFNGFPAEAAAFSGNCLKANSEIVGNLLRTMFEMYSKRQK